MTKKKIIALILSVIAICSFVGCNNKEDIKTEQPNDEIVLQEKEDNDIVGVWVVEKNEIYDGPMKKWLEDVSERIYYAGAEFEFTEDGIFRSSDGELSTEYEVLSDNKISLAGGNGANPDIYDYELNGDELILYGNYTGDFAPYGHSNALYFKRKS